MRNILAPALSQDYDATSHRGTAGFQEFFSHWELRSFIIISMILQMVLTFWTYQRKGISSQPVRKIVWLAIFLAADFSATLCLGGIFHLNATPNSSDTDHEISKNRYLIALWAPFILLHLGRHNKITTFSLGENEFWLSHLIRFIYHELTAILICILASPERQFRYTTTVLFITGTLKLGERVLALKRGSMREVERSTFKEADPGLNLFEIMRSNIAHRRGQLAFEIPLPNLQQVPPAEDLQVPPAEEPAEDLQVPPAEDLREDDVRSLCAAYNSFNKCKGIYTTSIFEYKDNRDQRGQAIVDMDVNIACNMIEMELSFAYDLFYTKSACMHTIWGWIARVISFISICCALGLFACADIHDFVPLDVAITYTLLILALILESVSFVEAFLSNHTFVQVGLQGGQKWRDLEGIIRRSRNFSSEVRDRLFQRRPAFMGQCNLLTFCFREHNSWSCTKSVLNFFELTEHHNNYRYMTYIPIDNDGAFKRGIFDRVRNRFHADHIEHPNNFYQINPLSSRVRNVMLDDDILRQHVDMGFEQCLLLWHLATDTCYRTSQEPNIPLTNAKYLSDYMLYLLVVHPSMLSASTTPELKYYRNAYAAATQLYNDFRIENDRDDVYVAMAEMGERIGNIPNEVRQGRNSLLMDACLLASTLNDIGDGRRDPVDPNRSAWEFLLDVWVDMLYFVAIQCRGKDHAEQLGSGGEFITYVWLFIVHSHMGSHYQI